MEWGLQGGTGEDEEGSGVVSWEERLLLESPVDSTSEIQIL